MPVQSFAVEIRFIVLKNIKKGSCEMKLTRLEQETIINFNAEEKQVEFYTCDPVQIRRLDKLVASHPENFKVLNEEFDRGELLSRTYSFDKNLITIRTKKKTVKMSDEQKARIANIGRTRSNKINSTH